MIVDGKLSLVQQAEGRRKYTLYLFFNAISYICLTENILILFALEMGCPDYYVAFLASLTFFGNIFMLFAKKMVMHWGSAGTVGRAWLIRNTSGLISALSPLVAVYVAPLAGIIVLTFGVLGFCISRSVGVVALQPLVAELTDDGNRGSFISRCFMYFNMICLFMLSVIILFLRGGRDISRFQIILLTGALAGFIATFFVFRIKESSEPMNSASIPIKDSFIRVFRRSRYRRLLMAKTAVLGGVALIVPISMLALKEIYKVSDSDALLFALVQFFGGMLISYFSGVLSGETGPRPLLILYFSLLFIVAFFWIAAPPEFLWYYPFVIFVLGGVCFMGTMQMLNNYFILSIDSRDLVGCGLIINAVSGLFVGLTGSFIAGSLIKLLRLYGFDSFEVYRIYFSLIIFILALFLFLILRLEPIKDWKVSKVLGLALAPKDIRTLLLLSRVEEIATPDEERETIEKLGQIGSGLSEKALLSYLDSPKVVVRGRALQAIRTIPFKNDTVEALMHELEFGEFSTAWMVVQILGEKRIRKAIPKLRELMNSSDSYLVGKCMISLAQMKDECSYERIENLFMNSSNPRLVIHGAVALSLIGDPDALELLLRKALDIKLHKQARDEIVYGIVDLATPDVSGGFYKYLKLLRKDADNAGFYIIEYLESLNDRCMDAKLRKLLREYNAGRKHKDAVVETVLKIMDSNHHRKAVSILAAFLRNSSGEFYPELLYAILCVLRKNVVI